MSKILVLGHTMDMGGTEVAMAALLQKLVEKKRRCNASSGRKKRRSAGADSEGGGSAPDDLGQKSRIRLWNGLWENGRHRQNGLSMPEEWAYF